MGSKFGQNKSRIKLSPEERTQFSKFMRKLGIPIGADWGAGKFPGGGSSFGGRTGPTRTPGQQTGGNPDLSMCWVSDKLTFDFNLAYDGSKGDKYKDEDGKQQTSPGIVRVSKITGIFAKNIRECLTDPPSSSNKDLFCPQKKEDKSKPKPLEVGDMGVDITITLYDQKVARKNSDYLGEETYIKKCIKCDSIKTWDAKGISPIAALLEIGGDEVTAALKKFAETSCAANAEENYMEVEGKIVCLVAKIPNCRVGGGTRNCSIGKQRLMIFGGMSDDEIRAQYPDHDRRKYDFDSTTEIMMGQGWIGKRVNPGGKGGIGLDVFCALNPAKILGGADPEKLARCFNELLNINWLDIAMQLRGGKDPKEIFADMTAKFIQCVGGEG